MKVDYIAQGNSADLLKALPDECIDLVVTSPPYDNLRDYKGYTFDFEAIAKELARVIKQGGIIVWVVGDATINGSETGTSFRQALYFMSLGLNLHDTMIYGKNNPLPQTHTRYEQCFEYMFIFSKGKPKTFNPLTINTTHAGKALAWGHRTLLDKKQCRRHRDADDIKIVNETKIRNNIFYYTIGGGKTGHPAVFPLQLAKDHIFSWSNKGDVVLDPFMGSGTTGVACVELDRHYIGFEISKQYCEIAKNQIKSAKYQINIDDILENYDTIKQEGGTNGKQR